MIHQRQSDMRRHGAASQRLTGEMTNIISEIVKTSGDATIAQSVFFSATAMTHVKRLLEVGGTVITDTELLMKSIDTTALHARGISTVCFIDDERVIRLAERKMITRAEIAADYGLAISGPKLMLIGSAPSAISRIIYRREHEPMSELCVLAAANGFANVVQLKEKLMDSSLTSIVVRGKKGGVPIAASVFNAIIHELTQ